MTPFSLFNSSSLHEFNQLLVVEQKCFALRRKMRSSLWCDDGSLKASEKIRYSAKQQSKSGCFFREVVDWIEEGSGFVWIEEKPKGTKLTFRKRSLWCLHEKERLFLQSCCYWNFLRETQIINVAYTVSFFEVKIPPPILPEVFVLIFSNQFNLCQLMFQSLLFTFQ